MAVRVSQVAVESLFTPDASEIRVSQLAVEALLAINLLRGDAGITTGEAFGSDGSVAVDSGQPLVGSAGIASAEAFGTDGSLNAPALAGSTGIASAEAFGTGVVAGPITGVSGLDDGGVFGSTGALVAGLVQGTAGIVSGEAFGADGTLSGPITGVAGIDESAMGASGSVSGPITGVAGIVSAEAVGTGGVVAGPILGSTGIVSAEAFGSGGDIQQPITGISGIGSAEAFGAGTIVSGVRGYLGIVSGETFGRRGAVLPERPFSLYIGGLDWTELKKSDTLQVQEDFGGRASATFTITQTGTAFRPIPEAEVEYYCGSKKLFGGFVQKTTERYHHPTTQFDVQCSCTDYRQLADDRVFSRVYNGPNHTLSTIIADIMAATLTAEGVTYESKEDYAITGGRIRFEDEPVSTCLDRICSYFGCDWRIDHYRRLRVERRLADLAPMVISDNDGVVESMTVTRNASQYRNRQGARTSVPTAGQRTVTLAGAGAWTYTLPFQLTAKPIVKVNTVATVVVLYSQRHLQPWDFAYELNSATIYHNPAQAAYTSTDDIQVTGLTGTIDVFWSENTDEIARRAARTGGSGIVEAVSKAPQIRDQAAAARFNENMMARLAQTTVEIQVEMTTCAPGPPTAHEERRAGWGIGQMVSVYRERPLIAGDFVITSVSFQEIGGRFLRYSWQAQTREWPTIVAIEVTPDGSDWLVDITLDSPVDWPGGTDLSTWGINNSGSGLGNGTFTLEPRTGGPLLRYRDSDNDYTNFNYGGGANGGSGGASGGGSYTGPFGGGANTSGRPPAGPSGGGLPTPGGGPTNPTSGALIVVGVNTSTREITVDRAHSFTTSYPRFDAGTRVVVMGVRGVEDATHSINTPFSRITVTGATTFVLEDVGPFTNPSPFENDRRGRVYTTDQAPRSNAGPINAPTNILRQLGAAGTESNTQGSNATFLLANSVPGFASRPLMVMAAATNPWVQQRDIQVVESVNVEVGTPSQGGPIRIDVKKNGASIFADGYVEIPAGETSVRTSNLAQTPTVVEKDDQLQPDVVAVGSEFPGCNVRVDVVLRG